MALKRPEMGSLIFPHKFTNNEIFTNNGIFDIQHQPAPMTLGVPPMALGVPETDSTTDYRHVQNPLLFFRHQKTNSNSPHNFNTKWPRMQTNSRQIPSFYEIDRISLKNAPTVLKVPESDSLMNLRHNYDLLEIVFRPKPNSNPKGATNTKIHKISHISLNISPISLKVPEMRPPSFHRRRRRLRWLRQRRRPPMTSSG